MTGNPIFHRTALLLGPDGIEAMGRGKVILFGCGGVGSWCAEALVRSGLGHLTLVDPDVVSITNVNRQLQALSDNVGRPKALELADRLCRINPEARIEAVAEQYHFDRADRFDLGQYDYVIDAIDSLANKVLLIVRAIESGATLFSSMGASSKLDIGRIRVGSFWKVRGCPLARHARKRVRKRLRNLGIEGDFLCVYSDEQQPVHPIPAPGEGAEARARINGSAVHVTGTFGFHLASLVISDRLASARPDCR